MTRQRAGIGIVVIAIALTMSVVPALSASADVNKSTGSAPHSAFCQAYHSNATRDIQDATAAAKAQKALEAGHWSTAKSSYLSAFGGQAKEDQVLLSTMGGAPSSMRAAVNVLRTYVAALKNALEKSNSVSEFTTAGSSLVKNPNVKPAQNTLARYIIGQCGSATA